MPYWNGGMFYVPSNMALFKLKYFVYIFVIELILDLVAINISRIFFINLYLTDLKIIYVW